MNTVEFDEETQVLVAYPATNLVACKRLQKMFDFTPNENNICILDSAHIDAINQYGLYYLGLKGVHLFKVDKGFEHCLEESKNPTEHKPIEFNQYRYMLTSLAKTLDIKRKEMQTLEKQAEQANKELRSVNAHSFIVSESEEDDEDY